VQEIYVRLFSISLGEVSNPEAYIFKVARSVIATFLHKEGRYRGVLSVDSDNIEQLVEESKLGEFMALDEQIAWNELLDVWLDSLPDSQKAAVLLCERDGYTYEEAAAKMDVSIRQVERYLLKARQKLSQLVQNEWTGGNRGSRRTI
jgi:RNA polymerase sigma-70 factor, ECF subfamily